MLWFWHIVMHMFQHLLVAVWTGDFQYLRMDFADLIDFGAQTTGDNHLAVFSECFTDGFQRLLHGAIDKAAGVNDHHVGIVVARHDVIAFSAKFGQDTFGIHQVFRTAQRDEADFRLVRNIAHRLKSSQLGSYQGRDCTAFSRGFIQIPVQGR